MYSTLLIKGVFMSDKGTSTKSKNSEDTSRISNKKINIRYFLSNNNEYVLEKDLTNTNGTEDKYLLNNNDIFSDEENVIDKEKKFKEQIKIRVSSFVNKGFDNIIVLLGAGASVVNTNDENGKKIKDPQYGKTVNDLRDIVNQKLKENNFLSIEELSNIIHFSDTELNNINFEDFLSHLEGYCRYNTSTENNSNTSSKKLIEDINKSRNKIYELIKDNLSYEFKNEVFKHGALINIALKLSTKSNKAHFVTTNYDTLIEEAAEKVHVTVFDGFTFSKEPVFDSDMFEWNLVRDVPYVNTSELEYKKRVINLLKLHGSLSWKKEDDTVYKRENTTNPLIIYPSSSKYEQTYSEPYFDLFAKFQELLKRKNTLLITSGFSFGDNHISRMIIKSIETNRTLSMLFTDYSIDDSPIVDQLKQLLEDKYPVALLKATLNDDLTDYFGYKEND